MRKVLVAAAIVTAGSIGGVSTAMAEPSGPPRGLDTKAEEWSCGGEPTIITSGGGRNAWIGEDGTHALALSIHFEGTFTPADPTLPVETEEFDKTWPDPTPPGTTTEIITCTAEFSETVPEGTFVGSGEATAVIIHS